MNSIIVVPSLYSTLYWNSEVVGKYNSQQLIQSVRKMLWMGVIVFVDKWVTGGFAVADKPQNYLSYQTYNCLNEIVSVGILQTLVADDMVVLKRHCPDQLRYCPIDAWGPYYVDHLLDASCLRHCFFLWSYLYNTRKRLNKYWFI